MNTGQEKRLFVLQNESDKNDFVKFMNVHANSEEIDRTLCKFCQNPLQKKQLRRSISRRGCSARHICPPCLSTRLWCSPGEFCSIHCRDLHESIQYSPENPIVVHNMSEGTPKTLNIETKENVDKINGIMPPVAVFRHRTLLRRCFNFSRISIRFVYLRIVFLVLALYIAYPIIVSLWWLLGSLLNSERLLPLTSSTFTLFACELLLILLMKLFYYVIPATHGPFISPDVQFATLSTPPINVLWNTDTTSRVNYLWSLRDQFLHELKEIVLRNLVSSSGQQLGDDLSKYEDNLRMLFNKYAKERSQIDPSRTSTSNVQNIQTRKGTTLQVTKSHRVGILDEPNVVHVHAAQDLAQRVSDTPAQDLYLESTFGRGTSFLDGEKSNAKDYSSIMSTRNQMPELREYVIDIPTFALVAESLGLKLTNIRLMTIFSLVDVDQDNLLEWDEFFMAFDKLQQEIGNLALMSIGLSGFQITTGIIFGTICLASILLFLFLGVYSFTGGDSFGAVVQSVLPIIAGLGVRGAHRDSDRAKVDLSALVKKTFEQISKAT